MKTKGILKIGSIVVIAIFLCLVSLKTFAHKKTTEKQNLGTREEQVSEKSSQAFGLNSEDNVSITIDSNTSTEDFNDIKKMLQEHQITATFSDIKRDDSGKLIGLKIVVKDENGNQAVSQMSSNLPIAQIVFGRKDGALYITQSNKENGAFAFFNRPNMMPFVDESDSLTMQPFASFGNFNFDDFFKNEDDAFFFNGKSMNLNELKEQMRKQFESAQNGSNNFSWFFDSDDNASSNQEFNFIDDPNSKKLIIIDGKEADFTTLDNLAKTNQLEAVDVLKAETAVSIYGQKAEDGAIIATSKKTK